MSKYTTSVPSDCGRGAFRIFYTTIFNWTFKNCVSSRGSSKGYMHGGSSARFPTKPTEKLKIEKMYAIKQIKICAEYRDMLPRPRLDLSGTPGLRPIGLSPGSWQTSLGLGSMSRYSAQILICIIHIYIYIYIHTCINCSPNLATVHKIRINHTVI